MKIVSLCTLITPAPYVFAFFVGTNKLQRLNFLIYLAIVILIMDFLKLLYGAPRPYMVNSDIKILQPAFDYGHPSGHALISYFMLSIIFEEFCFKRKFYISNSFENAQVFHDSDDEESNLLDNKFLTNLGGNSMLNKKKKINIYKEGLLGFVLIFL